MKFNVLYFYSFIFLRGYIKHYLLKLIFLKRKYINIKMLNIKFQAERLALGIRRRKFKTLSEAEVPKKRQRKNEHPTPN
jgi:hypothetical protein